MCGAPEGPRQASAAGSRGPARLLLPRCPRFVMSGTSPQESNPGALLTQEVVKLPLEFVRQLSIKVQDQRPGKTSLLHARARVHGYMTSTSVSCSATRVALR